MPLNYLDLEPQINQYAQTAVQLTRDMENKKVTAIQLIRDCGKQHKDKKNTIRETVDAQSDPPRCALLSDEHADESFPCDLNQAPNYVLLASDGSQVSPSGHDAVSVALVNASRICFRPGSGSAPEIERKSSFLLDEQGNLDLGIISDDLISLRRDLAEMEILASYGNDMDEVVIALGDGTLELFHQPRQGENFEKYFTDYLAMITAIHLKGMVLAAYTDRPRAALVSRMLEFSVPPNPKPDLDRLEDQRIFGELLHPGDRSAIFELHSTSSPRYRDDLALHFFYLNVGSEGKPSIARVEIPRWVADDQDKVHLVHRALLDQCRLMNMHPYPYILHRAHEEAVVRYDEKERLIERLSVELTKQGLGLSQPSNKQSAKNLGQRRRMGE